MAATGNQELSSGLHPRQTVRTQCVRLVIVGSEGERLYQVSLIIIIKARVSLLSEARLNSEMFLQTNCCLQAFCLSHVCLVNQLLPGSIYCQVITANNYVFIWPPLKWKIILIVSGNFLSQQCVSPIGWPPVYFNNQWRLHSFQVLRANSKYLCMTNCTCSPTLDSINTHNCSDSCSMIALKVREWKWSRGVGGRVDYFWKLDFLILLFYLIFT